MNPNRTWLLLVAVALSSATLAHEGSDHSKNMGAVRKEQKAWGIAGDAKAAKRTVQVTMSDSMRFTPDTLTVRHGETVRLVFRNEGKQLHEFVLGTQKELEEHAALMVKFPNMEHDEPYMVHVPAGKTGEIVWTFNRVGDFDFACLIPGHYQAGMVGKVSVSTK
ncbi:MAG TPA: cupredoxin family protein [Burkholderiaceae bacterium]|nr:cupredoxin family protein [Burkholderiaceae bacterium]